MTDDSYTFNIDRPPPDTDIHIEDWKNTPEGVRIALWQAWSYEPNGGTFSEELRIILEERDLTQKNFAEMIYVSTSNVNRWIRGRKLKNNPKVKHSHIPNYEIVKRIIATLECTTMETILLSRAYAHDLLWSKGLWSKGMNDD